MDREAGNSCVLDKERLVYRYSASSCVQPEREVNAWPQRCGGASAAQRSNAIAPSGPTSVSSVSSGVMLRAKCSVIVVANREQ